jgi:hypothetical protein
MPFGNISPGGLTRIAAFRSTASQRPVRRRRLARALRAAFLTLLLFAAAGCQCCCGTNVVNCVIDWGVDHAIPWECLYCSRLDLTRINRPGGPWCCRTCTPAAACGPGMVYAHRWNSPPPAEADSGLQPNPTYPAPQPGADLPPRPMTPQVVPDDRVEPLFPMPESPPPPEQSLPPDAPPGSNAGRDVVPLRYQRLQPAPSAPTAPLPAQPLVPVEVLFGN